MKNKMNMNNEDNADNRRFKLAIVVFSFFIFLGMNILKLIISLMVMFGVSCVIPIMDIMFNIIGLSEAIRLFFANIHRMILMLILTGINIYSDISISISLVVGMIFFNMGFEKSQEVSKDDTLEFSDLIDLTNDNTKICVNKIDNITNNMDNENDKMVESLKDRFIKLSRKDQVEVLNFIKANVNVDCLNIEIEKMDENTRIRLLIELENIMFPDFNDDDYIKRRKK